MLSSYLHLYNLAWSLESFYFWFMTGKSSWVPSHTQGFISHCCRWHFVSWLLQELLLSRCGWGVSLGQASLLILLYAFVDRDRTLALYWIMLETLLSNLICFRFYLSNSVCNNFYSYSDGEMYLQTLCNMWHVCWIMYDLGCCKSFIETRRGTRRTTGFIWVQVWQCDRLRAAIVLVLL